MKVMNRENDKLIDGADQTDDETESSTEEDVSQGRGVEPTFAAGCYAVMFGSITNVLLASGIFAAISSICKWGDSATFVFAFIALVPCAERISFVTEEVAKSTNDALGGLLSATFGNVTELVLSILALKAGLLRVVQLTLVGSILSNELLVLGCALVVGGIWNKEQTFSKSGVLTNCSLLVVSCLALSMPTVLDLTHTGTSSTGDENWITASGDLDDEAPGGDAPLWLSRIVAVMMLVCYFLLLFFQMKTHTHIFAGNEDDEDEPKVVNLICGLFWLAIITVVVAYMSQLLVDTIKPAAVKLGVPILFLSAILIPVMGNATEHAAAVTFAAHNKMEIALGSSIGSAVQIGLFAIPTVVIAGWIMDVDMSLNFQGFEVCVLMMSSLLVTIVLLEGRSFWITGALLLAAYFIVGASFWAHSDRDLMS
eukprot:TRINITY_DN54609_c0_g1_i1.p1 TRINITY_DN54609_c0_g1~~TRINITY_DN54609_c0_g1_i1.p1  ORF type:complete len:441 (+),score=78.56 TRINITY_DN54609_c0_g1_i1:50-1324(+)